MAASDANPEKPPPEKPAPEKPAPKALLVLEGIKSAILIAFWAAGLVFLIWNWSKLGDMVTGMSRLELLGVKVELTNKSYNDSSITSSGEKRMGDWTDEQRKAAEVRAMWIRPILALSKILWVDGGPEYLNNEISFLTAQRVNVRIARTTNDAIEKVKETLKGKENKFDLIVSSITRESVVLYDKKDDKKQKPIEQNPKGKATECPVHFFTIPNGALPDKGEALRKAKEENPDINIDPLKYYPDLPQRVSEYNVTANESLEAGFHFAQMLKREIPDEKRPPIIFYSQYANTIATRCSDVVTSDMFTLISSIFNTLERRRAEDLDHYRPPWSDAPRPSTTGAAAAG
jgi:hypothetical protein